MSYEQKVVWIGTLLGNKSIEDLEKFFLDEFGYHIKYITEFEIVDGFYKNLNCILFGICEKEIDNLPVGVSIVRHRKLFYASKCVCTRSRTGCRFFRIVNGGRINWVCPVDHKRRLSYARAFYYQ